MGQQCWNGIINSFVGKGGGGSVGGKEEGKREIETVRLDENTIEYQTGNMARMIGWQGLDWMDIGWMDGKRTNLHFATNDEYY